MALVNENSSSKYFIRQSVYFLLFPKNFWLHAIPISLDFVSESILNKLTQPFKDVSKHNCLWGLSKKILSYYGAIAYASKFWNECLKPSGGIFKKSGGLLLLKKTFVNIN